MANLNELRRVLLEMASPNTLRDGVVTLLDDVRGLVASRERHRDTQVVHHARIDQLASVNSETCTRIDQLSAQLAGLQRLVESLVNERGEFGQSLSHHSKTLVEHAAALDRHEEQLRDDYVTGAAAPIVESVTVQQLRAEVERLTREGDALTARLEDRDAVVADIVKRTAEKIAAWLTAKSQHHEQRKSLLMSHDDGDSQAIRDSIDEHGWAESYAEIWAADIRIGTWKEQP